jgi:glycosyltransferase involved in cell wall biosynthesis
MIRKTISVLLPPGSRRRILAGRLKARLKPNTAMNVLDYEDWIKSIEPQTLSPVLVKQDKKISIVVPCFNTPEQYIKELISSLINQSYRNWQLCLADGSADDNLTVNIQRAAATDTRIIYRKVKNAGIARNTNQALELADGDYIAFLDHDDILPGWALNEVAAAAHKNPKADLFYSDEDRLTEDGKVRIAPLFKPDWSLDLFMSVNYVSHFLVAKRSMINKIKRLEPQYDGSQDYDFVLRALDHNAQVVHIPKILYHMRMAETSTAKNITVKNYAHIAGQKAIAAYLKRNHIKASVLEIPDRPTNHRLKYELKPNTLVSIIIPFKDNVDLLKACIESIKSKTTYRNYEIILVSNNSSEPATQEYLGSLKNDEKVNIHSYDKPFNYSALNNFGVQKAKGDVLVFLNNDTEVIAPEWLEELASVAQQKQNGAVGALLLYPDLTIQHAGIIVGMLGAAGIIFRGLKLGTLTPFWLPDWPRNYLAVTGACLCVEKVKFKAMGGFNEDFIMAGSDVTLGIDLFERGYRNVYWPYAKLTHHESKSVGGGGKYTTAPPSDYEQSMKHYKPYLNYKDPYFNPNLDLMSEIPILRRSYGEE